MHAAGGPAAAATRPLEEGVAEPCRSPLHWLCMRTGALVEQLPAQQLQQHVQHSTWGLKCPVAACSLRGMGMFRACCVGLLPQIFQGVKHVGMHTCWHGHQEETHSCMQGEGGRGGVSVGGGREGFAAAEWASMAHPCLVPCTSKSQKHISRT